EFTPNACPPIEFFTFQRHPTNYRAIDITGYRYLIDMRNIYNNTRKSGYYSIYDIDNSILKVFKDGEEVYSTDLDEFAKKLVEKYKDSGQEFISLPSEELSFTDENEKIKIKIQFNNINIQKDILTQKPLDKIFSKGYDFYLLIK
ncbi:MAG: DUF4153 domain-containing protein, partial [Candidatus Omnitrophica bacterium]|nr:DUF4153 domain-containing protein [Candidatus Omnitrophota bacterium]